MPSSSPSSSSDPPTATTQRTTYIPALRSPPHLPTPVEYAILALYPTILVFGSVFALVSPQTRASAYDLATHAHATPPSYFARKDNVVNVLFVKRGWAWITAAFAGFVLTHPFFSLASGDKKDGKEGGEWRDHRVRAVVRWGLVTGWWVLVTQWCFGPPVIDRGFRYTGGKCQVVESRVASEGVMAASPGEVFSAAACRAAGGRWAGGHDISGHVFLLVLGSFFLIQEVGWVALRWRSRAWELRGKDPRTVVMPDGAIKGVDVEAEKGRWEVSLRGNEGEGVLEAVGMGGRVAIGVVMLALWMLLMTAIYFHTWFEKLTGLLVALTGLYGVYILPRLVPGLRSIVGLPGI